MTGASRAQPGDRPCARKAVRAVRRRKRERRRGVFKFTRLVRAALGRTDCAWARPRRRAHYAPCALRASARANSWPRGNNPEDM